MLQFSEITSLVRYHMRVEDQAVTSGDELAITNLALRRFVALMDWEDYTLIDTSLSTTAGIGTYAWLTHPVYANVLSLEIQDQEKDDIYTRVVPGRSIQQWLALEGALPGFPQQYRLYTGSDDKTTLELRPAPKYGGKTIRIDGVVEPEPVESEQERTRFRLRGVDDAFSMVLAAVFLAKKGGQARAQQLIDMAASTIRMNTGKEISPDEIRERLLP
jgi:hypothetical protein